MKHRNIDRNIDVVIDEEIWHIFRLPNLGCNKLGTGYQKGTRFVFQTFPIELARFYYSARPGMVGLET